MASPAFYMSWVVTLRKQHWLQVPDCFVGAPRNDGIGMRLDNAVGFQNLSPYASSQCFSAKAVPSQVA